MSDENLFGRIFQVNISRGGVPKLAVQQAEVTQLGIVGDLQRDREHHGGVERAVCIYSLELLQSLQEEGHMVFPGAIGENITLSGIPWEEVTPGRRIRLGDQVEVEVTRYTIPCNNLTDYFSTGDYGRVSPTKNPGWSRVYARVIKTGWIKTAQTVELFK